MSDGAQAYKTFVRITPRQVEVVCAMCRRIHFTLPSSVKAFNFCDHVCYGQWKRTRKGPQAGGWRGGTRVLGDGRVMLCKPEHHRANPQGYVFRSHVVIEEKLGRQLLPGEVVHHIDWNPANDAPNNLLVFDSESSHQKYHGMARGGIQRRREEVRA